jgi:hypothetical protein
MTNNVLAFTNDYKHVPLPFLIFDREVEVFFIVHAITKGSSY